MSQATVSVKVFDRQGQLVGPVEVPRVVKSDAEWRAQLTPEQFQIARAHGTERPFCGTLLDNKKHGVYVCVCCRLPLFASTAKFDSGTGWPSFFQPVSDENVATKADRSYGMVRVEILCATATSDTSSPTARRRPASGTASTPSRSTSWASKISPPWQIPRSPDDPGSLALP